HNPASLGTLLSLLTIRKCAMRGREFRTANRSIDREVRIGPHEIDHNAIAGREPSPLEVSTFVDLVETLLSSSSEREEEIIAGLLNGDSVKEIACRLKRSERTIYRT